MPNGASAPGGGAGDRYYITTPIYYVNDSPHIGHAYTTLACDVLARFMRLDGRRVHFLTGTDEHGQKVEKSAQAAGQDPQAFTDKVSENFRALGGVFQFTNDDFIRTTEDRHARAVTALWNRLVAADAIYLGAYSGWYSVRDEAYYTESELTKGPDGSFIAPSGAPVEWVEEPSYFFRLSQWQDRLLEFYERNPDFIAPESRRNEVLSFVRGGLQDLSVSRTSFRWGIPVPGDEDHVMYVWLDALTNYMSAVGFPETDSELYRAFWPADLHMVGKDILRFHAVFWPAFLMAADLPPPRRVFAHGWWTNEGHKISKSLGNVIDPVALVDRYGVDPVRYFLLREVPFGNDGDFSHRAMVGRLNGDLANDYGNLAQRVLSMIGRYCDGAMPAATDLQEADNALLAAAEDLLPEVRAAFESQAFHRALESIWAVIGAANRYVDEQAPWTVRKTDLDRAGTILATLADVIRRVAILTQPVTPSASAKVLDQLAVPEDGRDFKSLEARGVHLNSGAKLPKPSGVFPRFVEEEEEGA